jgi:hypothetical protein
LIIITLRGKKKSVLKFSLDNIKVTVTAAVADGEQDPVRKSGFLG